MSVIRGCEVTCNELDIMGLCKKKVKFSLCLSMKSYPLHQEMCDLYMSVLYFVIVKEVKNKCRTLF